MKHIDIHCHFFNIQYGFREALRIGWDMLLGQYPYQDKSEEIRLSAKEKTIRKFDPKSVFDLIDYIASLITTATNSCDEQYQAEQNSYKASSLSNDQELITVPLMMDIYYIFDDDYSAGPRLFKKDDPASSEEKKEEFEDFANLLKDHVLGKAKQVLGKRTPKAVSAEPDRLMAELDDKLRDIIREFPEPTVKTKLFASEPIHLSPGYEKHMYDLEKLVEENKETVYPFLAVDPRRLGIMKLVEKKVGKDKPFIGVKLYPALGYMPSHPALYPLYDFCIGNDVPITVHTSPKGLPSLSGSCYVRSRGNPSEWFKWDRFDSKEIFAPNRHFGEPNNWLEVFEDDNGQYSELKINFAHFGKFGRTSDNDWASQIIALMEKYNHVYSDISFCQEENPVQTIREIVGQHTDVADRLLFGTDYIMLKTTGGSDVLQNYFDAFSDLPRNMFYLNCCRFLGLEE